MNPLSIPHHLPIDLSTFGFVEREKNSKGKTIANRCGRDFFYYSLHYYDPNIFSPNTLSPIEIERKSIFGIPMPALLVWTGLSFKNIPNLFKERNLKLTINSLEIRSYWNFMYAMLLQKPKPFKDAIEELKKEIGMGNVTGIDVAISLGGLVDHIMFVYGYDDENLYVFDTHQTPELEYVKMTSEDDKRFIMKLPLSKIESRWTRWNRIWIIKKDR